MVWGYMVLVYSLSACMRPHSKWLEGDMTGMLEWLTMLCYSASTYGTTINIAILRSQLTMHCIGVP